MTAIRTPLRYPGGKAKALRKILPMLPTSFDEYREPFLGGGSTFIAIKQRNPLLFCKINDLNSDVYYFWKNLKEEPDKLTTYILDVKNSCINGRELHKKLQDNDNVDSDFERAVRFYIMNRISFSGLTDSGGYSSESFDKRFTLTKIRGLKEVSSLLANVEVSNCGYEELLSQEGNNVFIFLDPPYWTPRKHPLYGRMGDLNKFFDHKQFAINAKKCAHKWLITCDDSKPIRELFSFANIFPWSLKYNGFIRKNTLIGQELFITNYEPQIDFVKA